MVNISSIQLATLFAYDLTSIAYKPTPNWSGSGMTPNSTFNSSQGAGGAIIAQASVVSHGAQHPLNANATHQAGNASDAASADDFTSTTSSSCYVLPYDAPAIGDQTFLPYDQTTANVYRYRQQQSVNLGSWFVHENWMTPSVFECAAGNKLAEIDIANGWGSLDGAQAVLERHWDTFINESDFQYLATIGINTVRIPLGYWNLGPKFMSGTPFEPVASVYENCWPRVLRAVNQAAKVGVGVLLDLHGAVGSQNGQPHSGVSDGKTQLFDSQDNMDKTVEVLAFLAEQFASTNNVVGIELLNEPAYIDELPDFYTQAIDAVRKTAPNARTMPLYMHDGFDIDRFSTYISNRTDFVVQDHHSYFVFSAEDQKESGSQHTRDVEGAIAKSLLDVSHKVHRNLVVDEWSCALTPQSLESDGNATEVRKQFCTDQMGVYANTTAGWSFWAYKKEDCVTDPGWCFTAAVGNSLPHTFFSHKQKKHGSKDEATYNPSNDTADTLIMPTVSTTLLNTIGLPKTPPSQPNLAHRFHAIHYHRDTTSNGSSSAAAMNASATRGYADGMTTAKVFRGYGSKLGFVWQFIADAIEVVGTEIVARGTEHEYRKAFLMGLKEGENIARGS